MAGPSGLCSLAMALVGSLLMVAVSSTVAQASGSPPSVSAIEPNHGPPAGGTTVSITGVNFTGTTAVKFISEEGGNESDATSFTVNSDASITAISPPQPGNWGIVDVTVVGPGGTSAKVAQDKFGYGPIVDRMSPRRGPATGGTEVMLSGFGLEEASAVDFGSNPAASFVAGANGSITAVSPPVVPGSTVARVTVTTPEGPSATYTTPDDEPANFFAYGPTLTSIEPHEGPEDGGTLMTIHGAGFESPLFRGLGGRFVYSVDFGLTKLRCGLPLGPAEAPCSPTDFKVISDNEIVALAPPGTGTVDIGITTEGGISPSTAMDRFTYTASEESGTPPKTTKSVELVRCSAVKSTVANRAPRSRQHHLSRKDIVSHESRGRQWQHHHIPAWTCTTRLASNRDTSISRGAWTTRLRRGHVLYATGTAHLRRSWIRMVLEPLRPITPGRYRLTLTSPRGARHETIAIR